MQTGRLSRRKWPGNDVVICIRPTSASSHRCSLDIKLASREGMRVFLSALHRNTAVKFLDLNCCGLDCDAALVIGDVFTTTSTLSSLLWSHVCCFLI